MSDRIMNDYQLTQYAESCAADIIAEIDLDEGETLEDHKEDMFERAHEHADGSEHVIYYYKAHGICQNCDTAAGEEFLEDVGNPDPCTYDSLATSIAYGELRNRIEIAIEALIEGAE